MNIYKVKSIIDWRGIISKCIWYFADLRFGCSAVLIEWNCVRVALAFASTCICINVCVHLRIAYKYVDNICVLVLSKLLRAFAIQIHFRNWIGWHILNFLIDCGNLRAILQMRDFLVRAAQYKDSYKEFEEHPTSCSSKRCSSSIFIRLGKFEEHLNPVAEWPKALASQADIESMSWVRARLATVINNFMLSSRVHQRSHYIVLTVQC